MGDSTVKTKILLEVGAGVDQAAFNKAVKTVKDSTKDIDKSLVNLRETSTKTGKQLTASFDKALPQETVTKIQNLIKGIYETFSNPKINSDSNFLAKYADEVAKSFRKVASEISAVVDKTAVAKKNLEDLKKFYSDDIKANPKSVGKAVTFYGGSVTTENQYAMAMKQISGFMQNLTFTGNKLRSFDAEKYKNWEAGIDFTRIQKAVTDGIIRFTADGFKATGVDVKRAYSVLGVGEAQQEKFASFSGLKDFQSVKSNIEYTAKKFSDDVSQAFKKSFFDLSKSIGTSVEKFNSWYPSLQKAAKYQEKLPISSVSQDVKDKVAGAGLTTLSRGLAAGDLKLVNGELRILTENGLKAMKMTEDFAIANGLLKKSFSDQKLIKEIAADYGYSESTIKRALTSVRKEAEETSKRTGMYYKDVVANLNLYDEVVTKLTSKKSIPDPFRESSAGFQKGMRDLRAKYSEDTAQYKKLYEYIGKAESVINKTASAMDLLGKNGEQYRNTADRLVVAEQLYAGKLQTTNGVIKNVSDQLKSHLKIKTDVQKVTESIQQKEEYAAVSKRKITKAVSDAEKQISESILRTNSVLRENGVTEQRRLEIIQKIVTGLDLQRRAEDNLNSVQSRRKLQQEAKADPYSSSSAGLRQGIDDISKIYEKGTVEFRKYEAALNKAEKTIMSTSEKMKALGLNSDQFFNTTNRLSLATQQLTGTLGQEKIYVEMIDRLYKNLILTGDKFKYSSQGMKDAVAQLGAQYGNNQEKFNLWLNKIKAADVILQKNAALMNKMGQDGNHYLETMNRMTYAQGIFNGDIKVGTRGQKDLVEAFDKSTKVGGRFGALLLDLGQKFKTLASYSLAGSFIYGLQNALRGAVSVVLEFDQALYNLKAVTGATDFEMKEFGKKILDLASNTRFSVQEIADSMTILGQAGFNAQETIKSMDAIVALSAATMSDLKSNVDLVTTAIGSFQMDSEDATKVSDVFASAMNQSKLDLEKLKVAFNYVGPVAHNAGISIQETATMMSLLSNAGIRASTIGTSLRQIIDKLVNPTKEFSEAIATAGYTMEDFNPQSNRMVDIIQRLTNVVPDAETALKYFGVRGASSISVLTKTSLEEFNRMYNAIDQTGSVFKMQAIQMDGALSKTKNFVDNLQVLAVKFAGLGFTDIFKVLVDGATSFLKGIGEFGENHPFLAFFAKSAVLVAGLSGAIATLTVLIKGQFVAALFAEEAMLGKLLIDLKAIGLATFTLTGAKTSLASAILLVKNAASGLWAILSKNPIFMIVTAIATLATGLYALNEMYGIFDTSIDKLNRKFDESKKKVEEENSVNREKQKVIDGLTSIVKDNTESLEKRKVAIHQLIEAGVGFDRSLFDNARNVKEFDKVLKNSQGVLDDYLKKRKEIDKSVRISATADALKVYSENKAAGLKEANLVGTKDLDFTQGTEVYSYSNAKAQEFFNKSDEGKKYIEDQIRQFQKELNDQNLITEAIKNLAGNVEKLPEQNEKFRQMFISLVAEKGVTTEQLNDLRTILERYDFVTFEQLKQYNASIGVKRDEKFKNYMEEFNQKGRVNAEDTAKALTAVSENFSSGIAAIHEDFENQRKIANEQFKDDENKRLSVIDEINEREKRAVLEKNRFVEEEAKKSYAKFKESNELITKLAETEGRKRIENLKNQLQTASTEQKKSIIAQIAEEEKALSAKKANLSKTFLAIIESNQQFKNSIKDTAFYIELLTQAQEEATENSKTDLNQTKADLKVDKEVEREAKLAETRKNKEAAEIRAQARLEVKKRDLALVNELERINIQYAGDAARIEQERVRAIKAHSDEVIRIREDAKNKIAALGADTKKAEWDLLDAKMDNEFLEETSKNAKAAVKRLKDTLDLDFEVLSGKEEQELADLELKNIGNLENIEFQKYSIQKKYLDLKMEELRRYIELLEKAQLIDRSISTIDARKNLADLGNQRTGVDNQERNDRAKLDEDARRQALEEDQKTKIAGMKEKGQYTELEELQYSQNKEIEEVTRKYTIMGQLTEEGEKVLASIRERHRIEQRQAEQQYYAYQYQQYGEFFGGMSDLMGQFYEATGKKMKAFFVFQRAMKVAEIIMNTMAQAAAAGSQLGLFGIPVQAMIIANGMAQAGIVAGTTIAELNMAEGGKVPGYSPTPTADNIEANLTAEEWVHPVPTTRYYGDGIMEAVRTRSIPREILAPFAKGNARIGGSNFAEGGKADSGSSTDGSSGKDSSLQIVNILDPAMFDQYVASHAGQKAIMNVISRNPAIIKNALR